MLPIPYPKTPCGIQRVQVRRQRVVGAGEQHERQDHARDRVASQRERVGDEVAQDGSFEHGFSLLCRAVHPAVASIENHDATSGSKRLTNASRTA